jgi:hypothetical protein
MAFSVFEINSRNGRLRIPSMAISVFEVCWRLPVRKTDWPFRSSKSPLEMADFGFHLWLFQHPSSTLDENRFRIPSMAVSRGEVYCRTPVRKTEWRNSTLEINSRNRLSKSTLEMGRFQHLSKFCMKSSSDGIGQRTNW